MHAVIIGAGIAGPVAAMALVRAGHHATIVDAYAPADVGSWLTVAPNGLDALRAIDAFEVGASIGFPTTSNRLISHDGRLLGEVPIRGLDAGMPVARTVRRSHLAAALREEALKRGVSVRHGLRLASVEETGDHVTARFSDGSTLQGDVLIGADGVHSVVRRHIDPAAPEGRYLGLLNFGGFTPAAGLADEPGVWHMIFGKRAFFGYIVDPTGDVVWFANVPRQKTTAEERAATDEAAWKHALVELFSDDAGPAIDLIRAGRLELAGDNTHDLPSVPRWHRGRCVVLGDAAHAPSPSSGQGASMAIEDGVVLGLCLRDHADPVEALAAFERVRRDRVEKIVAQGARSSSSKAAGPVGRWFRDLLMPWVFTYVVTPASQAWLYDHRIAWA